MLVAIHTERAFAVKNVKQVGKKMQGLETYFLKIELILTWEPHF